MKPHLSGKTFKAFFSTGVFISFVFFSSFTSAEPFNESGKTCLVKAPEELIILRDSGREALTFLSIAKVLHVVKDQTYTIGAYEHGDQPRLPMLFVRLSLHNVFYIFVSIHAP